jgi:hypothetical protein
VSRITTEQGLWAQITGIGVDVGAAVGSAVDAVAVARLAGATVGGAGVGAP